jgi:O-antigen/teichoic acid export membrane protein
MAAREPPRGGRGELVRVSRRTAVALLTGSSAVQAGCAALAAALSTILLGPAGRGLMVLGLTTGSVVAVLAGLGSGSAFRARLPRAESSRESLIASYTWWSVAAMAVASGLAVIACAVAARFVDRQLGQPLFLLAVAVAAAGQAALAQQNDAWFAAGMFSAGGAWAAAAAAGGLVGMLAGAAIRPSPWVLLLAQGAATAAVLVVAGWRLRAAGLLSFAAPDSSDVATLLRSGAPVLGATFGFIVAMRADRFVLGGVAGPAAVGIYSLAATLSEAPRMLPGAVGQLVMRDVAVGEGEAAIRRARSAALGLTAAACFAIGAAGWALIVPVFGAEFAPARPVLFLLLAAEVCLVPYGLAIRALVGGGWTPAAGTLGILGAVAGLSLFIAAIPMWGMVGAGVASLALYAFLSAASWSMLVRRLAASPA